MFQLYKLNQYMFHTLGRHLKGPFQSPEELRSRSDILTAVVVKVPCFAAEPPEDFCKLSIEGFGNMLLSCKGGQVFGHPVTVILGA